MLNDNKYDVGIDDDDDDDVGVNEDAGNVNV